jgi:Ca-activated chloride channel family protein
MIDWGSPQYLYALLAIPALGLIYGVHFVRKRNVLRRIADPRLIPNLIGTLNPRLQGLKVALLLLSLAFLIVAAARPRWGEKLQIFKGHTIDIVIALDASKSMLAEDIRPNRLERAKAELTALIDEIGSDRVGITAFAGEPVVLCPLTEDLEAAKSFLGIVSERVVPVPGTNLMRAVEVSTGLFNPEEKTHKALVLMTDGDDLGPDPLGVVEKARSEGVKIFTVAVGTPEGAPIPEKDESGNLIQYKKDQEDQIVLSRTNEQLLITMTRLTGGRYYRVQGMDLDALIAELGKIKKRETSGEEIVDRVDRFPYPLILSLVFLVFSLALSDRRGRWLPKPLFVLLGVLAASSLRADVGSSMRKGNRQYSDEQYEEALRFYEEAEMIEPDAPRIHFNKGNAYYRQGDLEEAGREYQLATLTEDDALRAQALYNMGNTMFQMGQLDAAIGSYASSLLINPDDREAKENLEFALKMKEQQEGQEGEEGDQEQQQQQQQQQEQQQQEEQEKQEQREQEMTKEQMERILESLKDQEKEALERARAAPVPRQVDKDW